MMAMAVVVEVVAEVVVAVGAVADVVVDAEDVEVKLKIEL